MTAKPPVQELVETQAAAHCQTLFKSYGVEIMATTEPKAQDPALLYCGVVGFSGAGIRGSLAVAGSRTLLGASNPAEAASRDWAGELANQLMGHVKSRLLARGVTVFLSTPTVLRGEHLSLVSHNQAQPMLFTDPGNTGLVGLWVDVETAPGFVMASEDDPNLQGLEGGDALLF